jgi:hypothetical protein
MPSPSASGNFIRVVPRIFGFLHYRYPSRFPGCKTDCGFRTVRSDGPSFSTGRFEFARPRRASQSSLQHGAKCSTLLCPPACSAFSSPALLPVYCSTRPSPSTSKVICARTGLTSRLTNAPRRDRKPLRPHPRLPRIRRRMTPPRPSPPTTRKKTFGSPTALASATTRSAVISIIPGAMLARRTRAGHARFAAVDARNRLLRIFSPANILNGNQRPRSSGSPRGL